jgi:hypothetical protein
MRKIIAILSTLAFAGAVCGCNTGGVVPIGPDLYMVGGLGTVVDISGSAVKARYFQEATQFCATRGLSMAPVNSTSQDSAPYTFASAEVQFRCASPNATH